MDKISELEIAEPTARKLTNANPPRRKLAKPSEILLLAGGILIIAVLSVTFTNKLMLAHDVASARTVSDNAIAGIQKRDGEAVRALGTPQFQSNYTAANLTQDFKAIQIATLKPPTLDQHIVADVSSGRTILFIYKYTALKVPYYVRTSIVHKSKHWQLTNITGSADESKLLGGSSLVPPQSSLQQ